MAPAVGALTVGQSPRDDVLAEMEGLLGGVRVLQCGALDGLSPEEIRGLKPGVGEEVLVTRLRDGTEVRVSEPAALGRLQECVESLEAQVSLFLVLCTGELAGLGARKPTLFPGPILRQLAAGLRPRRVGVLTPAAEQVEPQRARWRGVAGEIVVEVLSPYSERERLPEVSARLATCGVDLVVMDCIGYTRAMKAVMQGAVRRPVLLAATVLARVAAEVLG